MVKGKGRRVAGAMIIVLENLYILATLSIISVMDMEL
jgi:hypothetical protein